MSGLMLSVGATAVMAADRCGAQPLDLVFIIDDSGSMGRQSNATGGHTRTEWAQIAVNGLVDDLDASGGVGGSGRHHVGVTIFGGEPGDADVALAVGAGGSPADVEAATDELDWDGNTPLQTGMEVGGADMVAGARSTVDGIDVRHVIVLLSDGRPWLDNAATRPNDSEIADFKATADEIYTVTIGETGGTGPDALDLPLMASIAKGADHAIRVIDAANLDNAFAGIFQEIACEPHIKIQKSADPTELPAGGGEVTYTYKVTIPQNGNVALSNVSVTDDKCKDPDPAYQSGDDNDNDKLDLDETWIFTCTQTITEDTTNTGTAHGFFGDTEVTDTDKQTVTVAERKFPVLSIVKDVENTTADRGSTEGADAVAFVGDTLTYTLKYEISNADAKNVVVKDVLPDGLGTPSAISDGGTYDGETRTITWNLGDLSVGDGTLTYKVVVADEAATKIQPLENTATITADDAEPDEDDATTQVNPAGFLVQVREPVCDGDVPWLHYDVTVENTDSDALNITFINPDGDDYIVPPIALVNGHAEGDVLWPGAEIDSDGNPIDWPGWTQLPDGSWVEGDEWDWVRPSVDVLFQVNPESTVTVGYPPATPECSANPPGGVEPETSKPTLPPTDTVGPDSGSGTSNGSSLLILFGLATAIIAISFVTPLPASIRRRTDR